MVNLLFSLTFEAPSGGPISVVLDRTDFQFAPDRVRFTVDLSASNFETTDTYDPVADKTYNNDYSPAAHDLIYLWDTGDNGSWGYPTNNPAAWRSKREAKGPVVQHVYDTAGSYDIGVTVIEPSSGKVSSATATIVVGDADNSFTTTETICVNPVGDNDFTGAPTGAQQVNADQLLTDDTLWTSQGFARRRWLFKRGGTYDVALRLREQLLSGSMFGAYGTGAKPILNFVAGSTMFDCDFFGATGAAGREIRWSGLRIEGTFDPTVDTVASHPSYEAAFSGTNTAHPDFTFHDLEIFNCVGTLFNFTNNNDADRDIRYAFDSIDSSDYGGEYNFIVGLTTNDESTISLTGSRIVQNVNSISDDTNIRATLRSNAIKYTYIAKNDIFNLSENNYAFRLCDAVEPALGGQLTVVTENAVECNSGFAQIAGNSSFDESAVNNTILDSNIICGAYNFQSLLRVVSIGVTVRNNTAWVPNLATINTVGLRAWASFFLQTGAPNQVIPDAPVRLYNNTFVNDRNDANNDNETSPIFDDANGQYLAAGVEEEANNIRHLPNIGTPVVGYAPLTSDVLLTPRSTVGRITEAAAPTADATRATVGDMAAYGPDTGSSAINAATGSLVAYDDREGTVRADPADVGALEN